ncbi:hypothetical protein BJ508DRAFT_415920 [Ascobolus immersus RN42]|uniref:F-box domain-containing protein n=1 Tax=Ascobolus immersus RN42 TaxID=1160509 RepID=A0A3N4I1W0_ASCIM|nr:hypothetical protein BJ508DRAFT_415920 [Ascobolus immersus RN42]
MAPPASGYSLSSSAHQIHPTPPEAKLSRFPLLPIEIRLNIYQHCTCFILLQLASTSSQLHKEINSHPSIIRASRGFQAAKDDDPQSWQALTVNHVGFISNLCDMRVWMKGKRVHCWPCNRGSTRTTFDGFHPYAMQLQYRCGCGSRKWMVKDEFTRPRPSIDSTKFTGQNW